MFNGLGQLFKYTRDVREMTILNLFQLWIRRRRNDDEARRKTCLIIGFILLLLPHQRASHITFTSKWGTAITNLINQFAIICAPSPSLASMHINCNIKWKTIVVCAKGNSKAQHHVFVFHEPHHEWRSASNARSILFSFFKFEFATLFFVESQLANKRRNSMNKVEPWGIRTRLQRLENNAIKMCSPIHRRMQLCRHSTEIAILNSIANAECGWMVHCLFSIQVLTVQCSTTCHSLTVYRLICNVSRVEHSGYNRYVHHKTRRDPAFNSFSTSHIQRQLQRIYYVYLCKLNCNTNKACHGSHSFIRLNATTFESKNEFADTEGEKKTTSWMGFHWFTVCFEWLHLG